MRCRLLLFPLTRLLPRFLSPCSLALSSLLFLYPKDADDIPLLNVKSSVLKKVVEYMRYHADNPMKVSAGRPQTHGRPAAGAGPIHRRASLTSLLRVFALLHHVLVLEPGYREGAPIRTTSRMKEAGPLRAAGRGCAPRTL